MPLRSLLTLFLICTFYSTNAAAEKDETVVWQSAEDRLSQVAAELTQKNIINSNSDMISIRDSHPFIRSDAPFYCSVHINTKLSNQAKYLLLHIWHGNNILIKDLTTFEKSQNSYLQEYYYNIPQLRLLEPCVLRLSLFNEQDEIIQQVEQKLLTSHQLTQQFLNTLETLPEKLSPELRLVSEIAAINSLRFHSLAALDELDKTLNVLNGKIEERDFLNDLHAWIDPRDQSVQPYRYFPADQQNTQKSKGVLFYLSSIKADSDKRHWDAPPLSIKQFAQQRQLDLVQFYPAGDRQWQHIARQRFGLFFRDFSTLHPQANLSQILFFCSGNADRVLFDNLKQNIFNHYVQSNKLIILDRLPKQFPSFPKAAYCVIYPSYPSSQTSPFPIFQSLDELSSILIENLSKAFPIIHPHTLEQNIAHFFLGTFHASVGDGENLAAATLNLKNSQALGLAYQNYAHAALPFQNLSENSALPDGNLLCFGNPLNHPWLAQLQKKYPEFLPITWKDRWISEGDGRIKRSKVSQLLICKNRPDNKGMLMIIDGHELWQFGPEFFSWPHAYYFRQAKHEAIHGRDFNQFDFYLFTQQ